MALDTDKIDDAVLALLFLTRHDQWRAWKGFDWEALQYPARLKARVRDLWSHSNVGVKSGAYSATVQPHAVVMVRIDPV